MTHDEPPWKDQYSKDRAENAVISNESLTRYFRTQVKSD